MTRLETMEAHAIEARRRLDEYFDKCGDPDEWDTDIVFASTALLYIEAELRELRMLTQREHEATQ
jgi:hypothetical protein